MEAGGFISLARFVSLQFMTVLRPRRSRSHELLIETGMYHLCCHVVQNILTTGIRIDFSPKIISQKSNFQPSSIIKLDNEDHPIFEIG